MVKAARNNLKKPLAQQWLYIACSRERDLFLALILDGNVINSKIFAGGGATEKLLPNINTYHRHLNGNINGIILCRGGNISFSQERILISIINTLAHVWRVPVAVINNTGSFESLPKLNKLAWRTFLAPKYRLT